MNDHKISKDKLETKIKQLQKKIAKLKDIIDEKEKLEKILKSNEDGFKSLYENAAIGIYRTTVDGKILMANDALVKMLGYSSLSEIPDNPMNSIYIDLNDRALFVEKAFKEGKVVGFETEFKKKDGTEINVRMNSRLIKVKGKKKYYLEGTIEDITEKNIAEKQLIASKEKAEEMNKLKGNFLATMSHELRTPLVGILGFAEIFKNELKDPEQTEMAESIYSSGRRLMETLNSLLDFSRLEAQKIEINKKPHNVSHLVADTVRSFINIAERNNLYLNLKIVDEEISASLDAHIFNKIVFNLLNNAIKYTEHGGINVEVDSIKEGQKRFALIKIKDSGIGIPEASQKIIFEEFRQASEGINRQYEGSGLGLTITKRYVKLLGGEIFLESKVGKGSTFVLRFPEVKSKHSKAKVKKNKLTQSKPELSSNFPNVLLVDNDQVTIDIAKIILKNVCFIEAAINGPEALNKVNEKVFDAVLMDINLGAGLNGLDVTKEIRKNHAYSQTPIVALTAYALDGDREKFIQGGCTHYISKPFDKESLINLMNNILRK